MAEGNRKDPRARVLNMTVRYKSATVDEFIENHSHDISRGGIFIKTRAPFPAGTLLKFEVRIAEDQRLMQGVGRVVWRREPERAEEGFPAGMGIKFIKTGEGAAELIAQIVAAREGEESSFDAGARENGADSGSRRSLPPPELPAAASLPTAVASDLSLADVPTVQAEEIPPSGVPAEGEIRVSHPPKKRAPAVPERKVVLKSSEAPPSDKTPISTRGVSAQATRESAPNRPAHSARERGSLVDETTAPRARAISQPSARAEVDKQTSPSIYGLVAILGVVALTVLFVQLVREPDASEPAPPPQPPPSANTAPVVAPPPVPVIPPAAPVQAAPPVVEESGEGAPVPSAAIEPAPTAAAPTPPAVPTAPVAAAPAAVPAAPSAAPVAVPAAGAVKTAPVASSPSVVAAPKPAPGAVVAPPAPAAKPVPPAAKPPAAAEATPKPVVKPPAPAVPAPPVSIRPPASEAAPVPPGTAGAASVSEAAKKRPPAAAAPAEPEPAPKPAAPAPKPAAPSDDNPY
ncbi:MAG: hypothetical protein RL033_8122 [Pseudomonadota bacterium]|jgi:uncharacterized protein (TIGR02266 family)